MKLLLIDAMHIIGNILAMDRTSGLTKNFCSEIEKIKRTVGPTHMLVCFDDLSRSWRRQISQEYKQSGNGMPLPVRIEASFLPDAMKKLGYRTSCKSTMEARDIASSIVTKLESHKGLAELEITIVAGGKRYLPLVSEKTCVFSPYNSGGKPQKKTKNDVMIEHGFTGKSLLEFFSIVGDKSIGVSGVKGVGVTKATELLNNYGTLKSIHEHQSAIDGSLGEKVRVGFKTGGDCSKSYHSLNTKKNIDIGLNFSELLVSNERVAA